MYPPDTLQILEQCLLYVFAGYPWSKLEKIILEDPPIPSIDWLEDK